MRRLGRMFEQLATDKEAADLAQYGVATPLRSTVAK